MVSLDPSRRSGLVSTHDTTQAEGAAATRPREGASVEHVWPAHGLADPTPAESGKWTPSAGGGAVHHPSMAQAACADNQEDQVLAKLAALTGHRVELAGRFGDVCSGVLQGVYKGLIHVEDASGTWGLPRAWPIDSVATYAIDGGTPQPVAHRPPMEPRLRRSSDEIVRSLNLAMSTFGSSGSPSRPAPAEGRDAVLRIIDECSGSSTGIVNVLFPALLNWGTTTSRHLKYALEGPAETLAAVLTAAPRLLPANQVEDACANARNEFLARATEVVDERLRMVVSENQWSASPDGRAFGRALDAHMVALGNAATRSYREWKAGGGT